MYQVVDQEIILTKSMESFKHFIGVGGIVEKDNKFLLVEEANGPLRNKWGFPSGLVNKDETI